MPEKAWLIVLLGRVGAAARPSEGLRLQYDVQCVCLQSFFCSEPAPEHDSTGEKFPPSAASPKYCQFGGFWGRAAEALQADVRYVVRQLKPKPALPAVRYTSHLPGKLRQLRPSDDIKSTVLRRRGRKGGNISSGIVLWRRSKLPMLGRQT